jgi:hypothetical protein
MKKHVAVTKRDEQMESKRQELCELTDEVERATTSIGERIVKNEDGMKR